MLASQGYNTLRKMLSLTNLDILRMSYPTFAVVIFVRFMTLPWFKNAITLSQI